MSDRRSRPHRHKVSFTDAEQAVISRRMEAAGESSFERFARPALLDGEVRVRRVGFDHRPLVAQLSSIGNNINQIARHVNTEDTVTFEQMRAARGLLEQVQAAITAAIERAEKDR